MTVPAITLVRRSTLQPAPAVSDNFNRANSTTDIGTAPTGQTWTNQAGTWGITSNVAYLVSSTTQAIATIGGRADGDISVTINLSPAFQRADTGLIFRYANTSNYMLVALTVDATPLNAVRVFKNVAGTFTQIGSNLMSGALANGSGYTTRVLYNGTSLNLWVNGTNILSTTATTGLESNTAVGIRINNVGGDDRQSNFDNFTLRAIN